MKDFLGNNEFGIPDIILRETNNEIKKRIIFRIYKWNDLFRFGIWARKKQIH